MLRRLLQQGLVQMKGCNEHMETEDSSRRDQSYQIQKRRAQET